MSDEPCERFQAMILDEGTGEISIALERTLLDHVEACEPCRTTRVAFRKQLLHARSLLVPEPAPTYWDNFVPRLHVRISDSKKAIALADVQRKLDEARSRPAAPPATVVPMPPRPAPEPARALDPARRDGGVFLKIAATILCVVALAAMLIVARRAPAPSQEARLATVTPSLVPMTPDAPVPAAGGELDLEPAVSDGSEVDAFVDDLSTEDADLLQGWLDHEVKSS